MRILMYRCNGCSELLFTDASYGFKTDLRNEHEHTGYTECFWNYMGALILREVS